MKFVPLTDITKPCSPIPISIVLMVKKEATTIKKIVSKLVIKFFIVVLFLIDDAKIVFILVFPNLSEFIFRFPNKKRVLAYHKKIKQIRQTLRKIRQECLA